MNSTTRVVHRNEINIILGNFLKQLRLKNQWNQEYVANLIGVTVPAISNIETGYTDLSISRLVQFAEIYKIQIVDFFVTPVYKGSSMDEKASMCEKQCNQQIIFLQNKVIELYEHNSLLATNPIAEY